MELRFWFDPEHKSIQNSINQWKWYRYRDLRLTCWRMKQHIPWPNQQTDQQWKCPRSLHCNQVKLSSNKKKRKNHISTEQKCWISKPSVAGHHSPTSTFWHLHGLNTLSDGSNLVNLKKKSIASFFLDGLLHPLWQWENRNVKRVWRISVCNNSCMWPWTK